MRTQFFKIAKRGETDDQITFGIQGKIRGRENTKCDTTQNHLQPTLYGKPVKQGIPGPDHCGSKDSKAEIHHQKCGWSLGIHYTCRSLDILT